MAKIGRDGDPISRAEILKARNNFQIKSWKGRPYASKWPKARGHPTSPVVKAWVAHFAYVACLSKIPDPNTFNYATELSKGTGWYYRDVLASAAVGKLYQFPGYKRVTTPTASVHRTSSEALTANVRKVLTPNETQWDNNSFWSPSVNPTRLTMRSSGLYLVGAWIKLSGSTSGYQRGDIVVNGGSAIAQPYLPSTTNNTADLVFMVPWLFNTNDYIEAGIITGNSGKSAQLMQLWVIGMIPEMVFP